ncbi:hypothetical protein [Streptomyces beijiangensis]|uniref:Uncharacterized protein n=1 Tax=Streptomyces beijiangensis TaxID=163361 RepID=A0A939FBG7_9ACTN|nr:hypothetical protein [Streptomyces beijiangensis]MBO0515542.1 hypothetical protein [Streptomyces beijiangensis]
MASGEYRVDLSALDSVVTKLNGIIEDVSGAKSDSKYKTFLPAGALGSDDFLDAKALHVAHEDMKGHLENIVEHIHKLMDDFGTKTKKTHGAYQDQDADVTAAMQGGDA